MTAPLSMSSDSNFPTGDRDYEVKPYGESQKYVIGDAIDVLSDINDADLICLDDAWARPLRANQFGVTYPTHRFKETESHKASDLSTTTVDILEACKEALNDGGWLIADADAWLLPRLLNYFIKDWGDVFEDYMGGGYRKIGYVTYIARSTGEPHRGTAGEYFSNGGYPVVFAQKGETDRKTSTSAAQPAHKPTSNYGWGSVKPVLPYKRWVEAVLDPADDDHLVVPCAGTAPAAIGAELAFNGELRCTCIDTELEAYKAFEKRLSSVLDPEQPRLAIPEAPPRQIPQQETTLDDFL